MIRCTLELVPGGYGKPEVLGVIEIENDLVATVATDGKRGSYNFRLFKKRSKRVAHEGRIENYPRLAYHPWNLIYRVLWEVMREKGRI